MRRTKGLQRRELRDKQIFNSNIACQTASRSVFTALAIARMINGSSSSMRNSKLQRVATPQGDICGLFVLFNYNKLLVIIMMCIDDHQIAITIDAHVARLKVTQVIVPSQLAATATRAGVFQFLSTGGVYTHYQQCNRCDQKSIHHHHQHQLSAPTQPD